MNANLLGLVAVGMSIAAFSATYALLRHRPLSLRVTVFGAFGLLSAPSILFAVYYLHVFPEWAWFYTLRSWRGSEFLVVALGCACGAAAALLPRLLLALPLFAVIALAVIPYLKPILSPLASDAISERWHGNTCLQSTPSTCGPASVTTILRRLGSNATEREAAHAAFSYTGGTEAWYLARYIRNKGFTARFVFTEKFSPSVGLPAVVGVRLGGAGHFIAILAMNGDQVTVADPLQGETVYPQSELERRYVFTGFNMIIAEKQPPAEVDQRGFLSTD